MDNILKVKNVHDYNTFVGHADQRMLVGMSYKSVVVMDVFYF